MFSSMSFHTYNIVNPVNTDTFYCTVWRDSGTIYRIELSLLREGVKKLDFFAGKIKKILDMPWEFFFLQKPFFCIVTPVWNIYKKERKKGDFFFP